MSLHLYLTVCGFGCSCKGAPINVAVLTNSLNDKIGIGKSAFDRRSFKKVNHIEVTGNGFGKLLKELDKDIVLKVTNDKIDVYIEKKFIFSHKHGMSGITTGDYDFKIIFENSELNKYYEM